MTILSCGSKTLKFTLMGEPRAMQRPRFNSFSKRAYTPQESIDYMSNISAMATLAVQEAKWNICHKDMPVEVKIIGYRSIPSGIPVWKKNAFNHGLLPPLTKKTDADNLAKIILDGMTKIVYEDDCQVFKLEVELRCSEQPRVEVEVIGYFTNIGEIKDKISMLKKKEREK